MQFKQVVDKPDFGHGQCHVTSHPPPVVLDNVPLLNASDPITPLDPLERKQPTGPGAQRVLFMTKRLEGKADENICVMVSVSCCLFSTPHPLQALWPN